MINQRVTRFIEVLHSQKDQSQARSCLFAAAPLSPEVDLKLGELFGTKNHDEEIDILDYWILYKYIGYSKKKELYRCVGNTNPNFPKPIHQSLWETE